MAEAALRSEERIGLAAAVVLHGALVAVLLWHPRGAPEVTPPDRIEVTISEDVSPQSTSPEPAAEAAPDVAPQLGEPAPAELAPPEPEAAPPPPRPEPPKAQPKPEPPKPVPRPVARPSPPRPVPKPTLRPQPPRPVARPAMRPTPPRPSAPPAAKPAQRPAQRPAASRPPASAAQPRPTQRPAGGSRIGDDFLKGVPGAQNAGAARNPPAQLTGAQRASLSAAISRALKPYWAVPQGPDTELLVTRVRFRLSRDGRLVGEPEILSTTGVTDANKAQVDRHREQAIRAIRLAKFELPDDLYSSWQTVITTFDRRLSQ